MGKGLHRDHRTNLREQESFEKKSVDNVGSEDAGEIKIIKVDDWKDKLESLKKGLKETKTSEKEVVIQKDTKPSKIQSDYLKSEINRLGDKLAEAKKELKKAQKVKLEKKEDEAQKRVDFFQGEFEKAKAARDRVNDRAIEKERRAISKKGEEIESEVIDNNKRVTAEGGNNSQQKKAEEAGEEFVRGFEQTKIKTQGELIAAIDNFEDVEERKLIEDKRLRHELERENSIEEYFNYFKKKKEDDEKKNSIEEYFDYFTNRREEEKIDKEQEEKLEIEASKIEKELEKMPKLEREKINLGLRNFGFFAQEEKSKVMAKLCEFGVAKSNDAPIQEQGKIKRFLASSAEKFRKDEQRARKQIEEREKSGHIFKRASNAGLLVGNIMKYGRTVADVVGWTAGSPLRYVMMGAQFFSWGAEVAKEARLKNQEVIEKTRMEEDKAYDEAWKIYETAKEQAIDLEESYLKNLPQDLLERLKRSEPGTASNYISQRILKKDLEFAIKHGRANEERLKEYDRIITQYGTVDALALGLKYTETAGKAVIAGMQIETAYLLIKNLPQIIHRLESLGSGLHLKSTPGILSAVAPEHHLAPLQHHEVPIAPKAPVEAQKISELATIHKGEGIINVFQKQLEHDPIKFGFKGDIHNTAEIHKWAQHEAASIAIKNHYFDPKNGNETRIFYNEKNPSKYILDSKDGKIEVKVEHSHEYQYGISETEKIKEVSSQIMPAASKTLPVETTPEAPTTSETSKNPVSSEHLSDAVKSWITNSAKINLEKSNWLSENYLNSHTVKEVLDRNFVGDKDLILGYSVKPEYGSPAWWGMKTKEDFQYQLEKIFKNIPADKKLEYQNYSLKKFLEYSLRSQNN